MPLRKQKGSPLFGNKVEKQDNNKNHSRYGATILGTGSYLPEKVLTNADLEKIVDTTDEWIRTRTGIRERRIAAKDEAASDLAAQASQKALEASGLKAEDIGLIIVATITPDMQFPSTACLVQSKIGAKNAVAFDISAACAGFIYAMNIAQQFIETGVYKNALVIGAEKISSITDWTDRSTCVLFGDGAGAAILGRAQVGEGIISTYLASDGGKAEILKMPGGGSRNPATHETLDQGLHYLKMDGKEVFKHAVSNMGRVALQALEKCGLTQNKITYFVPHQANARIIHAVAKRLGIIEDKIHLNVERLGNMSSASTAVGLDEVVRKGCLKKDDIVVLVGFGSGLVWGSLVIKWS